MHSTVWVAVLTGGPAGSLTAALAYTMAAKADRANLSAWDGALRIWCKELARIDKCLELLDLELATAVLAKMKPRQSAQLIPLLSEERALAVSRFVGHPLGISPTPGRVEAPAR